MEDVGRKEDNYYRSGQAKKGQSGVRSRDMALPPLCLGMVDRALVGCLALASAAIPA